jgi:hypothetical protein
VTTTDARVIDDVPLANQSHRERWRFQEALVKETDRLIEITRACGFEICLQRLRRTRVTLLSAPDPSRAHPCMAPSRRVLLGYVALLVEMTEVLRPVAGAKYAHSLGDLEMRLLAVAFGPSQLCPG